MRIARWSRRLGWKLIVAFVVLLIASAVAIVAWVIPSFFRLGLEGDSRDLRPGAETPARKDQSSVLVLALDGVDRALLYEMVRAGELPNLARLLGPEAHFDDTALAPMPTSTLAAWATIFTGTSPAVHGVAGNEYFIRGEERFAAPAPVSIFEPDLVLQTYTDDYANDLLAVPTIYELLRARDPELSAWVCMSQFYRGADRLLLADRTVLADAFEAFLDDDDDADDLEVFADIDREVIENLVEELEHSTAPRILTVYLSGADHFAHKSDQGPDQARREYMRDVLDDLVGQLAAALDRQGALDDRYVVVVSDHGHTAVRHDDEHALDTGDGDGEPPAVFAAAGYRLRPFEHEVDDDQVFDAVMAYGGALAYVYLADRSTCAGDTRCDWSAAPRFVEDVQPIADRFLAAMPHAIDLVLVRKPGSGTAGPLEVYLGAGETEPIAQHLAAHPRPGYVAAADRFEALAVGPAGDHAGDLILVARNGAEPDPARRYYFSSRYHSWHGSPGRVDSEIPLIIAHPRRSSAELRTLVRATTGDRTDAAEIAAILERMLR